MASFLLGVCSAAAISLADLEHLENQFRQANCKCTTVLYTYSYTMVEFSGQ